MIFSFLFWKAHYKFRRNKNSIYLPWAHVLSFILSYPNINYATKVLVSLGASLLSLPMAYPKIYLHNLSLFFSPEFVFYCCSGTSTVTLLTLYAVRVTPLVFLTCFSLSAFQSCLFSFHAPHSHIAFSYTSLSKFIKSHF